MLYDFIIIESNKNVENYKSEYYLNLPGEFLVFTISKPFIINKNEALIWFGVYPAEAGHRSKYPNEQAILINGGKELPTVNGNPHNPKGKPVEEQTLTGVFFHAGNSGRASLSTNAGKPISEGCQTGPNSSGSKATFKSFMDKVPANFKGSYYLKSKN